MQEETPETQKEDVKRPWWMPELSTMFMMGLFILVALFLPASWIEGVRDTVSPRQPSVKKTFGEDVAKLDALLAGETPSEALEDQKKFKDFLIDIQIRRVVRVGPMAGDHLPRLKKMLQDFQMQLDVEEQREGKKALRKVHAKKIVEAFPRLRLDPVFEALWEFDMQYARAKKKKP